MTGTTMLRGCADCGDEFHARVYGPGSGMDSYCQPCKYRRRRGRAQKPKGKPKEIDPTEPSRRCVCDGPTVLRGPYWPTKEYIKQTGLGFEYWYVCRDCWGFHRWLNVGDLESEGLI